MTSVNLIVAIGLSGQIGLNGQVPWHDDVRYAAETARDLARFQELTTDGILIMGSATATPELKWQIEHGRSARRVHVFHKDQDPGMVLDRLRLSSKDIWICGGARVYHLFAPYVDWHHISVIPYDGPADTFMPPIAPGWGYRKEPS